MKLRFRLTDGDSQACVTQSGGNQTTDCSEINLDCDAVLSVRIVPPGDTTVPYISVCDKMEGEDTLCSISYVNLPPPKVPIPEQVLEVQMAVFPESAVPQDPVTHQYICPPVQFGATGLPITALPGCTDEDPGTCPKVPAVGGRAFYYPGDEMTVVTLGCTDLDQQLRGAACTNEHITRVRATVTDFDSTALVDPSVANRLTVSIGEPMPLGTEYALFPQDMHELTATTDQFPTAWLGDIDATFSTTRCLVVLEDGAQTTSTITCGKVDIEDPDMIEVRGERLARTTLSQVLAATGQASFPDAGMTIGIVLDHSNNPAAGQTVTAMPPAGVSPVIQYLSADRTTIGGTQTSASGIFVAQDAPYGTMFSVPGALAEKLGGRVQGKATIVVIQLPAPDSK